MMSRWRVSKNGEFEKYQEDKIDDGGKKPWAGKAAYDENCRIRQRAESGGVGEGENIKPTAKR